MPARDWEAEARAVLPRDAYDYVATGAGIDDTLAANLDAWRHWWLQPHVLRDVSGVTEADLGTTLLGTPVATPFVVAPTGYQRLLHPEGEVATARAAAASGSLFVLSTRATSSLDAVAAVAGPWWLQVYVLGDRELTAELVRRSVAAGARALVLTGDTPVVSTRTRQVSLDLDAAASLVHELGLPDDAPLDQSSDLTYDDIGWLREVSGVPVVVKGVLRADDARGCVAAGADAVWVSNHGARQLDGVTPTAVALPEVADAVGAEAEVYVDGGVRNGRDALRALALGARAVALGRPVLWALAVAGDAGVRELLAGQATELTEALRLAGLRSPAAATRDVVRPG